MDYVAGSSVHGIFQARILEWGCHFLLQRIFPTQESNPYFWHLLHWQMDSLPLVPTGKPISFLTGSLMTTDVGLQLYEFEINYKFSFSPE